VNRNDLHAFSKRKVKAWSSTAATSEREVKNSTKVTSKNSVTASVVSVKTRIISNAPTESLENQNEKMVILFSKDVLVAIVLTNVVIVIFCSVFLLCFCCRRKWKVQNNSSDRQKNMSSCSRKIIHCPLQTQTRSIQNSIGPEITGIFRFRTEDKPSTADTNEYDICQDQPHAGNETDIYLTAV
jgi:multisubunit Na+/H+ antiporter MnhC subunit